jgi:hypothetical protein
MGVEAAAPLVSPSGAGTIVLGPQAMEGALKIHPGDILLAGFAFKMPAGHPATTAVFTSSYVSLLVKCPNGSTPALTIPIYDEIVPVAAGSTAWYPSSDQASFQVSVTAPDLCAGAVMDDSRGATFTTAFAATDTVDKFSFRFHYAPNGKSGGWSGTAQRVATAIAMSVAQATLRPQLSLTISADKPSAIPGDVITYTATVTNTGPMLSLTGDLYAAATGTATATVMSYWVDVYTSTDGTTWAVLAGTAATAPGYVAAVPSPGGSGLALSPTPLPKPGVTYPTAGDPILGTSIGSHDLADWRFSASAALTSSQVAAISAGARIRSSFHLEVTPVNPNVAQPSIVNVEMTGLLAASGPSDTVTNLTASISPPGQLTPPVPLTTATSLMPGGSATWSAPFTVPPSPAKSSGESDADYLATLSALEGQQLSASAVANGRAGSSLVTAPAPPAATTTEHLPILTFVDPHLFTVFPDRVTINTLELRNTGGLLAEGLSADYSAGIGSPVSVTDVPGALDPGSSAFFEATYSVPASQQWGHFVDTASVTWHDRNGNSYGPVSSANPTDVLPPYGTSPSGLFGEMEDLNDTVIIDPTTGALHTLTQGSSDSNLAGDPATHRLYAAQQYVNYFHVTVFAQLVTYFTTTGGIASTPLAHAIVGLQFDPTSGDLYAVTADLPRHIVRIDPVSGEETILADFNGGALTPTAFDPVSHTYYVIAEGPATDPTTCYTSQLFSLNTSTGTLTTGPVLANPVLAIAFDSSVGSLFAISAPPATSTPLGVSCAGQSVLFAIDPVSGVETQVGTTDLGMVTSDPAIDSASHTIYVTQSMNGTNTRLLLIDDQTGAVVQGPAMGGVVGKLVFIP